MTVTLDREMLSPELLPWTEPETVRSLDVVDPPRPPGPPEFPGPPDDPAGKVAVTVDKEELPPSPTLVLVPVSVTLVEPEPPRVPGPPVPPGPVEVPGEIVIVMGGSVVSPPEL